MYFAALPNEEYTIQAYQIAAVDIDPAVDMRGGYNRHIHKPDIGQRGPDAAWDKSADRVGWL
jgi:hypothetical protein